MAGVADPVYDPPVFGRGPFSPLARSQYRALAAMRWSMFRNSLRSTQGAIELGARSIATVFYVLMGLGMAAGIGAGLAGGFGLERLAGTYFESVKMPGAWVVAGAAGILLAAAVIASAWPAMRAARVDVIQALRAD